MKFKHFIVKKIIHCHNRNSHQPVVKLEVLNLCSMFILKVRLRSIYRRLTTCIFIPSQKLSLKGQTGLEVIKLFSCSTQLNMKFFLLINVKMLTIVGILTFINRKNSIINLSEPKKRAEFPANFILMSI